MTADLKLANLEPKRPDQLKFRRVRRGAGFTYVEMNEVRDEGIIRRLKRLAVPPASRDTLFDQEPTYKPLGATQPVACNTGITLNGSEYGNCVRRADWQNSSY